MKALVAQELSGPSGLAYTDVDEVGGEDVVVIDVGAAGVCLPDLLLLRGEYQMRFPLSKGAEALESLANGGVKGRLVLQP
jgi:D-arabinose 1-dehydrogenase-like Zn-dependent alcohol dehydrogenase